MVINPLMYGISLLTLIFSGILKSQLLFKKLAHRLIPLLPLLVFPHFLATASAPPLPEAVTF